ncbi:MAG: hypothetical protein AAF958_06425 [Planctomycetota bacterium]
MFSPFIFLTTALSPSVWLSITLACCVVGVPLRALPGTVVDDPSALKLGTWSSQRQKNGYVGSGYRVSDDPKASIDYVIQAPADGEFQLRMIYSADAKWADSVCVGVDYRGVVRTRMVSQQKPATDGYYKAIGRYKMQRGESLKVRMHRPRGGKMYADAMQLIGVTPPPPSPQSKS